MAETIKGINVVIGAETTGLQAALSDVNKKTKNIQSELKQVEKLLKLDPKNTELLAQKQKLLGDAVATSREKLDHLREAQQQVSDQFARGEISEGQYRAFQREVEAAKQELGKLDQQLKDTASTAASTAQSAGDKFKALGKDIEAVGDKMKGMGGAMSVGVTAPIVAGFAAVTEGTREFREELGKLEANAEVAGGNMDQLQEAMRQMHGVTGELDSNVEGLSNLLAAGWKGDNFEQLLDQLSGAAIKFKDTLKFEGMADGLQETLATGAAIGPFAELLERSGIVLDDFNAGLTEAIENGREQEYVLETLAETGLANVYETYKKNNSALVESAEAQYNLQEAMAGLGETLEPILTKLTNMVAGLANTFNELSPTGQKIVLVIAAVAAAIGPLLVVMGSLLSVLPALGAAFSVLLGPVGLIVAAIAAAIAIGVLLYKNWDEIKAKAAEIWDGIKETITGIVDGIREKITAVWTGIKEKTAEVWAGIKDFFAEYGVTLLGIITGPVGWSALIVKGVVENWSAIKEKSAEIWAGIKDAAANAWNQVKDAIINPIEQARQLLQDIIQRIKDAFAGMSITIPKPKLPHITVDTKTKTLFGQEINLPSFSIDWYKQGGIFNKPSVIGVGESGTEAVLPLDRLPALISQALREALSGGYALESAGVVITDNTFVIRNEADIVRVARELYRLERQGARGRGLA